MGGRGGEREEEKSGREGGGEISGDRRGIKWKVGGGGIGEQRWGIKMGKTLNKMNHILNIGECVCVCYVHKMINTPGSPDVFLYLNHKRFC